MKRGILAAIVGLIGIAATGAASRAAPVAHLDGFVPSMVQDAQYFWAGRRYCWYPDGWHGPGYYWCGYAWREGFGWGGPLGWRGWGPRPGPRRFMGPGPIGRPRGRHGGHWHH